MYGDSEEAAFYGCGYAMAEDRIFQMALRRRVVQGRVAEILGAGPEERFVQQDRKSRIFALHRRARETVTKLPAEIRCYLEAFTAGVNAFLHDRKGELNPLFNRYGGTPEPWSAADCIAHLGSPRPALQLWLGKRSAQRSEKLKSLLKCSPCSTTRRKSALPRILIGPIQKFTSAYDNRQPQKPDPVQCRRLRPS